MRPVQGYREAKATNFNAAERLPVGGYILKILDVKEENFQWGDVIVLRFDIAEGEQKGFFQKQFDNMSDEYKKWKGTYRLNVPSPKSSSEEDQKAYKRALGFFKAQIEAINQSNNINIDCSTEWNISVLKNKFIGAVFGNKEWEYEGKTGWFTNCDHLVSVQDIRAENFSIPKDKPLKKKTSDSDFGAASPASGSMADFEEIESESPVPF